MKKFATVIAVLALLVACMMPAAFAADAYTAVVGDVEVEMGEGVATVKVPVSVEGTSVDGLEFNGFTVSEGAKIVKVESAVSGAMFFYVNGNATLIYADTEDNHLTGTLLNVVVEVPTDKVASFTVSFASGTITSVENDLSLEPVAVKAGTITIAHDHAFGEWKVVKAATCTEKGLEERVCTCGEKETREIEMIAHTPAAAVKENEKAADCVNAGGYDMVVYCSVCKTELSREHTEIKALGHDVKDVVPAYDCDKGVTYNKTCGRCDWTEEVVIEAHDHVWGAATVIKAATVDETGEVKYVCKHSEDHGCTGVKIEETPKLNPEQPDPTGDITPYIAMGVLTMVALISSAAYMLLKRKAI